VKRAVIDVVSTEGEAIVAFLAAEMSRATTCVQPLLLRGAVYVQLAVSHFGCTSIALSMTYLLLYQLHE